ncbi:MAG TPA: universal stress protein [Longimicrobiales bacterium]
MKGAIMVPLDGSVFSEQALPLARQLARKARAELHLVHVHLPVQPAPHAQGFAVYDGQLEEEARAREAEYLASLANRTAELAGVVVRRALLEGPVAPALSRYAEEEGVGLVVMTTHGRGGLSRAWLGSVADALVREATIPVLLLRPRRDGMAEEEPREFRRILIPLDGSPLAEQILEPAIELGRLADAEYTLLQVVVPPFVLMPPTSAVVLEPDAEGGVGPHGTDQYLADVAARLREVGHRVKAVVETYPNAAQAVLDYARENAIDLIAMSTHGRTGFSRVALGSVSDKVLRGADVPVLLRRGRKAPARGGKEGGDDAAQLETVEPPAAAPR